jgi:hypothetical protein
MQLDEVSRHLVVSPWVFTKDVRGEALYLQSAGLAQMTDQGLQRSVAYVDNNHLTQGTVFDQPQ